MGSQDKTLETVLETLNKLGHLLEEPTLRAAAQDAHDILGYLMGKWDSSGSPATSAAFMTKGGHSGQSV